MDKLTPKALSDAVGISQVYAWQIVNGKRPPSRPLALQIWKSTGLKFGPIAHLSDESVETLAEIEAQAA